MRVALPPQKIPPSTMREGLPCCGGAGKTPFPRSGGKGPGDGGLVAIATQLAIPEIRAIYFLGRMDYGSSPCFRIVSEPQVE